MRAVTYRRVSTTDQDDSGLGLAAQAGTIDAEVKRRRWQVVGEYVDVKSGKSMQGRTELGAALTMLAAGDADVLVVAKLDRLSRSVSDFCAIMAQSHAEGWALNVCDLGCDTTTPSGKMMAQLLVVLAEWEREMISDRTRSALAALKRSGVKLGRPSGVSRETVTLIRVLRATGATWGAIAAALTEQGIPTAQGGTWHAATVRKIYRAHTDPETW